MAGPVRVCDHLACASLPCASTYVIVVRLFVSIVPVCFFICAPEWDEHAVADAAAARRKYELAKCDFCNGAFSFRIVLNFREPAQGPYIDAAVRFAAQECCIAALGTSKFLQFCEQLRCGLSQLLVRHQPVLL